MDGKCRRCGAPCPNNVIYCSTDCTRLADEESRKPPEGIIGKWSRSPLCNMASVFRFSSLPVHHRESVAEHTYYVVHLAWVLAMDIQRRGTTVAFETLFARALVHDLDESLTGDIIRPFKHSSPELFEALTKGAREMFARRYQSLPGGTEVRDLWEGAKDNLLEGRIVDFADVWSVYLYLYREVMLGSIFAREKLKLIQSRVEGHNWIHPITSYAFELAEEIGRLLEEVT